MRKLLFIAFLFFSTRLFAAPFSIGPIAPLTCTNDTGVGTVAWINPSSATVNDLNYSSAATVGSAISNYLSCTYPSFTNLIPANSKITGLEEDVPRYNSAITLGIKDSSVNFSLNGTLSSNLGFTLNNWDTSRATVTYGGNGNLWGLTLARGATDVNNLNFRLSFTALNSNTGVVDVMLLTVFYQPPTTIYNGTIYNGTLK